jgi:sulfatase modifying factor 1
MKVTNLLGLGLATFVLCGSGHAATIPTVPVGNPGNAGDVQSQGTFGAVGYNYRIGKYEVTNAHYVEFLNGVDPTGANTLALYNTTMTTDARGGIVFNSGAANGSKYEVKTGRDNNPVLPVYWYASIRFANWLHNGQGGGDTETGAYTLLGGTPTPSNGNSITRNAGAKWWLPSEDEWYKAAYHKNDGVTGNYWDYPTSTDAVPYSDQPPGSGAPTQSNTANVFKDDAAANGYDDGFAITGSPAFNNGQNYLSDVGAYTLSTSPYGTFDQGGNALEWNESLNFGSFRGFRGGAWESISVADLDAATRRFFAPSGGATFVGFRVATIPEPAGITLCCAGIFLLAFIRSGRNYRLAARL